MRWTRILIGVGGLLLVLIGGVAIYIATLDLSRYRAEIEAAAQEQTGRALTIAGTLELSWTPAPRLLATDVRLANAEWSEQPSLAQVGEMSIAVELWPLVSGDLHIKSLRLADVEIQLERSAEGRGNWEGVLETAAASDDHAREDFAKAHLQELSVERLNVTWRPAPEATARTYNLGSLTLAALSPGRFDLELGGTLDGVPVALSGGVPVLVDWMTAGTDLPITLGGHIADRPVTLDGTLIRGKAGDAGPGDRLEAKQFSVSYGPLVMSGTAAFDFGKPRPHLSATLSVDPLNLDEFAFDQGKPGPDPMNRPIALDGLEIFDGEVTVSVVSVTRGDFKAEEIKASLTLKDKVLRIGDLSARVEGGALEGGAYIDVSGQQPRLSLDAALLGADIGTALRKAASKDLLVGRGDIIAALTATGRTPNQLIATLGGRAGVIIRKGEVLNAYWELLAEDLATRFLPTLGDRPAGKLNCAVLGFDLKSGQAASRVILVDSDRVLVGGKGTVNLPSRTLDLRLVPQPKDASLISLATPILINGPIEDPSVAPDPLAVAKDVGTAVIGGMINPLAVLLPFLDSGSGADPCPAAIAVAEGQESPSGESSGEKPGAIEGFFDKLRKAIE
jgi:AsmA family protein